METLTETHPDCCPLPWGLLTPCCPRSWVCGVILPDWHHWNLRFPLLRDYFSSSDPFLMPGRGRALTMPPARLQFAPISQKLCKDGPLLPSSLTRPPSTGPCRSDSVPSSGQPLAAPASQPGHLSRSQMGPSLWEPCDPLAWSPWGRGLVGHIPVPGC